MSAEEILKQRSGGRCELCSAGDDLRLFSINPANGSETDSAIFICRNCQAGISAPDGADANHWRCLSESMWSEYPAVQVMAWRILKYLSSSGHGWADDLLGQLYLDDERLSWAAATPLFPVDGGGDDESLPTVDSNGTRLSAGDTVTLIKDLEVKGANFTAKRGTTVKSISLTDDPKFVEGKVNGTVIVLVAAYLKKA